MPVNDNKPNACGRFSIECREPAVLLLLPTSIIMDLLVGKLARFAAPTFLS